MDNTVLIIVLSVIVIGGIIVIGTLRGKRLTNEGKIVKRSGSFYKEESIFSTTSDWDKVLDAIKRTDFSHIGVQMNVGQGDYKAVLFQSGHGWNAVLSPIETNDERLNYRFCFTKWKTRDGIPWRMDTMNMMVTSIEKMFFSIDPTTSVQTRLMQTKVKTDFF